MKNRRLLGILLAIGLIGGLVLRLLYASHLPLSNDEGSYLYDGLLLSQGKWPFLTSFSRAPALMFLMAFVVKVFGRSFLAGRMISIFAGLGSAYFLYLIGRKLFNQRVGIAVFLLYALLAPCVVHTIYLHTQPLELFFILAGVWFVAGICKARPCKRSKAWPFVVAGVFFGLAVLVRETAALYPAAMVLAIFALSDGKSGNRSHLRLREAVLMGVSSLAVWGGVWGFIVSQVGWEKVKAVFLAITTMHDTGEYMSFGFTLKKKFEVFHGALGENFILYFLAVIFVAVLAVKVGGWVRERRVERNWLFLLVFCSVPFLFYGLYYRRLQAEYLAEFMPALVLMSAVALDRVVESAKCKVQSAKFFVFPFLIFNFSLLTFNFRYMWLHQHGGDFSPEALESSVRFVQSEVAPDEEIFTAVVAIPFLSGNPLALNISRPTIFGYPHLEPGIKYALFPTEEAIINYLENKPVNWIIIEHEVRDMYLRSDERLEDYLLHQYDIIKVVVDKRTGTEIRIAQRRIR